MKPKVVTLRGGLPCIVIVAPGVGLYHHPQNGLVYGAPLGSMLPSRASRDPLIHVLAHMKSVAMYSGGEPEALDVLRKLAPFTRHEEQLITTTAKRATQFIGAARAKVDLPSRAKAITEHIAAGLDNEAIWMKMRDDYFLEEKARKALLSSIEKQRVRLSTKHPPKRIKKKGVSDGSQRVSAASDANREHEHHPRANSRKPSPRSSR